MPSSRRTDVAPVEPARLPQPAAWPQPPQVAAAPPGGHGAAGIPWTRYLDAVKRHRWLVLLMTFVGIGGGWLVSRFVQPKYETSTSIWISSVAPVGQDGDQKLVKPTQYANVLTSYTVLEKVATRLKLYAWAKDSIYQGTVAGLQLGERVQPGRYTLGVSDDGRRYTLVSDKGRTERGTVGDSIGRTFGLRWLPDARALPHGKELEFGVTTARQAAAYLKERLGVQLSDSSMLYAKLVGPDPVRDAEILNALGEEVVATVTQLKQGYDTRLSGSLGAETAKAAAELRAAEQRLASFKAGTITEPSEEMMASMRDPTVSSYFNSRAAVDSLQQDRQALDRLVAQARRGEPINVGALLSIPSARQAPELAAAVAELGKADSAYQAMRRVYTPEYQPVKDLEASLTRMRTQTIPQLAGALSARLATTQQDASARVYKATGQLRAIPARTIQEMQLRRDVQLKEQRFAALKARADNAGLAQIAAVPEASVYERAVPSLTPIANTRPYIFGVVVLFSLALGVGLALLLDRFDPKIRYPEQVTELGLPIIGAVPHMRAGANFDDDHEEAAQALEAFRALRLNLRHQQPGAGPVQVTISSPGAGEGKSLLSSNLALSFAEAGYRTLLIDADVRRGTQHDAFNVQVEPGLTDFLAGHARADEIARRSTHPNLLVIPSGARISRGPELLMSDTLPRLLAAVRPLFNAIIIDSPPLGAGADALVLGTATGHMMMVIRANETNRKMAESKLAVLRQLPINVLGAVLNDIPAKAAAYEEYGFIDGYYTVEPHTRTPAGVAVATVQPHD